MLAGFLRHSCHYTAQGPELCKASGAQPVNASGWSGARHPSLMCLYNPGVSELLEIRLKGVSLAVLEAQTPESCLKRRLKPLQTSSTTGQTIPDHFFFWSPCEDYGCDEFSSGWT